MTGDATGSTRLRRVRRCANHEAPTTEDAYVADPGGHPAVLEVARQLADWLPHSQPYALGPFVDRRPGVVEGVHRQIREHVEIGFRVCTREDVLECRSEVFQVDMAIR